MLDLHGEVVGKTPSTLGLVPSIPSRTGFRPCKRLRVCSSSEATAAGIWDFAGDSSAAVSATDDAAVHFKQQAATARQSRQSADKFEDVLSPRTRVQWSRGLSQQLTDHCLLI